MTATDAPTRADGEAMIVVGIDGSPLSRDALAWAVRMARRLDVGVRALQVSDDVFTAQEKGYCSREQAEEWSATARREGLAMMRQMVDDLGDDTADVEVELDVMPGQPADVLVEASRDAELLVVGPRGMGRLRLLLGSVSLACLQQAHCPVVVVRGVASGD
jgi:nucleotide-binding universal stress UspA family protein